MTIQDVDAEPVEGTIWVIRAVRAIIELRSRFAETVRWKAQAWGRRIGVCGTMRAMKRADLGALSEEKSE